MRRRHRLLGVGEAMGGSDEQSAKPGANAQGAIESSGIETERSTRTAGCRGEMCRYRAELRLRRTRTGAGMTLRNESVGIEQD